MAVHIEISGGAAYDPDLHNLQLFHLMNTYLEGVDEQDRAALETMVRSMMLPPFFAPEGCAVRAQSHEGAQDRPLKLEVPNFQEQRWQALEPDSEDYRRRVFGEGWSHPFFLGESVGIDPNSRQLYIYGGNQQSRVLAESHVGFELLSIGGLFRATFGPASAGIMRA